MRRRSAEPIGGTRVAGVDALSDEDVVRRVLSGDKSLFEIIMRRYNQRLFRTIRVMVGNDAEAEDILQEAYVRAYQHLGQFEGRASFSTWLTRIALHEAMARRRKSSRFRSLDAADPSDSADNWEDGGRSPEEAASSTELRGVLDQAITRLPEPLRLVFMLREVEGLTVDETAGCLGISAANVKVRLHRARSQLRSGIERQLGTEARQLHAFAGARCDALVASVLRRIGS